MRPEKVTVYTVTSVAWEYTDEYYYRLDGEPEIRALAEESDCGSGISSEPIRSFLTREKAEAHCLTLERKKRKGLNPFNYGGLGVSLGSYTSLHADTFKERIRARGLEPPKFDRRGRAEMGELYSWWEKVADDLTEEQRHAVWDLLDQVRFFTVVSVEVELEG